MTDGLRVEGGAIARITLDRPGRGNAMSPADMKAMSAALDALADEARVLIIDGAGDRTFCGGYDLAELDEVLGRPGEDWDTRFPELTGLLAAAARFPAPIVGAITGHAVGGGVLLASICDVRVGQVGAFMQVPAVRIGLLYPLPGLRLLVQHLGASWAQRLLLLGERVDVRQLASTGFFTSIEPPGAVRAAAQRLADRVASGTRDSGAALRGLLAGIVQGTSPEGLAGLHAAWTRRCLDGPEARAALDAVQADRGGRR